MWGEVREVVPQHDGTQEVLVDVSKFYPNEHNTYEDRETGERKTGRWWPTYHIDRVLDHEPTEQERKQFGRAWAPLGGLA